MFEIWNGETANVIGEYRNKAQAYADVRSMIFRHGTDAVQSWVLLHDDGDTVERVAAGDDLIAATVADRKRDRAQRTQLVASIRSRSLSGRLHYSSVSEIAIPDAEVLSLLRACA